MDIFKTIWPHLQTIEGVNIDLARIADAEPIGRLSRKYIETGLPGWVWDPGKVSESIWCPDSLVLVGRKQKEVIASAIIKFSRQSAHLNLLVIAEGFRRLGIGSCLLGFLENASFLYGKTLVNLEVRANNESAMAFYLALGYRKIKVLSKYYHNGENAIQMSRNIRVQPSARITLPNSF